MCWIGWKTKYIFLRFFIFQVMGIFQYKIFFKIKIYFWILLNENKFELLLPISNWFVIKRWKFLIHIFHREDLTINCHLWGHVACNDRSILRNGLCTLQLGQLDASFAIDIDKHWPNNCILEHYDISTKCRNCCITNAVTVCIYIVYTVHCMYALNCIMYTVCMYVYCITLYIHNFMREFKLR